MYQGLSRGNLRGKVDKLHALMIGVEADLTLLFDMDPDIGHSRAKARATTEERFEDFGAGLQAQMRQGFLGLAQEFPKRFRIIDAGRAIGDVATDVIRVVREHLK